MKLVFLITYILIFSSCKTASNANADFLGSWNGCIEEQYIEFHLFDDVYFAFFPNDSSPMIRESLIKNDSLYMLESNDKLIFLYQMKVDENNLFLQSDAKKLILNRLSEDESIEPDIAKDSKLLKKYLGQLDLRYRLSDCHFFDKKYPIDSVPVDTLFENYIVPN
ncbi:MAG: hypothetical protein MJA30_00430 [Cytophagales bacterium]|nr:hypothetical protein [Cytophagales bacterium]